MKKCYLIHEHTTCISFTLIVATYAAVNGKHTGDFPFLIAFILLQSRCAQLSVQMAREIGASKVTNSEFFYCQTAFR